jgi:hypothetical protein
MWTMQQVLATIADRQTIEGLDSASGNAKQGPLPAQFAKGMAVLAAMLWQVCTQSTHGRIHAAKPWARDAEFMGQACGKDSF